VTHWCSPARSILPSRTRASSSTAPVSLSSAATFGSPWAAHSEPSRATTTPQLAPHRPREALRPLRWFPSALHRLPDARRRLPPPPLPLSPSVALIRSLCSQLTAPISSPQVTDACAQDHRRCWPPEHRRRQ
jgi:hypothetical protein